jgi:hypothetical protein
VAPKHFRGAGDGIIDRLMAKVAKPTLHQVINSSCGAELQDHLLTNHPESSFVTFPQRVNTLVTGTPLFWGECPELFSEISSTTRLSLPNQYGNRLLQLCDEVNQAAGR